MTVASAGRWHLSLGAAAIALVAAAGALTDPPVAQTQMIVAAALVALFGVPHGALDWWCGQRLERQEIGEWRPVSFVVGYSVLAVLFGLVVYLAPVAALGLFLAMTVYHFGAEDVRGRGEPVSVLSVTAAGLLPLVAPTVVWPEAVAQVFAAMTGVSEFAMRAQLMGAAPVLTLGYGLLLLFDRLRPGRKLFTLVEIGAIVALYALLPPLLAFTAYFCLLHAPRHTLHIAALADAASLRRALGQIMPTAIAITALTIALGLGAAILMFELSQNLFASLAIVMFWGLAMLTVPHVLLLAAVNARLPHPAI